MEQIGDPEAHEIGLEEDDHENPCDDFAIHDGSWLR
jgi:hypothetical protein